jgi:hypothetical protein
MKFVKKFTEDILILKESIKNKHKFAFSKYADGEFFILNNLSIRNIDDWFFNSSEDSNFQKLLYESFKYKDPGYYIGVSCPCCDKKSSDWFLNTKGSTDDNTTFANIFVNNNYEIFKNELLPLFNNFNRIFLIANKDSNIENLKNVLNITDFYGIGLEAFKTDLNLIDVLIEKIKKEDIKDSLFLFCSGPLGNVLSHKLWEFNKNNTYIDIGSTLNIWTGKNIRDYQSGRVYSNKICNF